MEIRLGILALMFLELQTQNEDTEKKFHVKNCTVIIYLMFVHVSGQSLLMTTYLMEEEKWC